MIKATGCSICKLICLSLMTLLLCSGAAAQSKGQDAGASKKEKKKLPQSGLIAGTKTGEYGGTQIDGPWGGIHTTGKQDPISGSCSKTGSFSWTLKVFNNTKNRYNVSLGLVQYDIRNRQLKSDTFFAAIAAGQKIERVYQSHPDATQCAVQLNNWKAIERKKSPEELKEEIDNKKKELADLENEAGGGAGAATEAPEGM